MRERELGWEEEQGMEVRRERHMGRDGEIINSSLARKITTLTQMNVRVFEAGPIVLSVCAQNILLPHFNNNLNECFME